MSSVMIAKIEVDETGCLRLYPDAAIYDFIYRAACGVHWNQEGRFLGARCPTGTTILDYFRQIASVVASEYGDTLVVGNKTEWSQVPENIRRQIESLK